MISYICWRLLYFTDQHCFSNRNYQLQFHHQ